MVSAVLFLTIRWLLSRGSGPIIRSRRTFTKRLIRRPNSIPLRAASPSTTLAGPSKAPPTFLRLTTSSSHSTNQGGVQWEMMIRRMQKQSVRKDLVFMWRSHLYSDVRLARTGNFGGSHESTTAIFSSHRFILISRPSYFHTVLLSWHSKENALSNGEPPTLTLPSPPFTPASLHFTLGFVYTGTLIFAH